MCEDIDECEELGPDVCLNGICVNTPTSYECECSPGYVLDHTGHICMGINLSKNEFLVKRNESTI